MTYINPVNGRKNGHKIKYSNPLVFISKLEALESKLDTIETKKMMAPVETFINTVKEVILCVNEFIRKQYSFNINAQANIDIKATEQNFSNRRNFIKIKIHSLKRYLQKRKLIDNKMQEHTDILNIYWHSKAEFEIMEEINTCLEQYGSAIKTLEI